MSEGYRAIGWNREKKFYDLVLGLSVAVYLLLFSLVSVVAQPNLTIETILIRGLASSAFILLHVILCIGPLARLDSRFLPLLYNRRHLGVTMFGLALAHGLFSIFQFHLLGDTNPLLSLLTANSQWSRLSEFPFELLGLAALGVLFLMAATSHDFWLHNLTAPVWKRLHMLVYLAYGLLVGHVSLGYLQSNHNLLPALLMGAGLVTVLGLHLLAAWRGSGLDADGADDSDTFVEVCRVSEIPENRAVVVSLSGERVAVFRYDGKVSALSNVCQHQNGPLGEGRIVDGCVTCPWHGFQYLPDSGASPAPFEEKVPTFSVQVRGDVVFVDPRPHPAGTPLEPARIEGAGPQGL